MKSREFGTWPPRNGLGAERQYLYDEYNRAFKKERPPQPKEYASSDIKEFYRVPEMKDVSGNPYERNAEALAKQSSQARGAKALKRQLILRQVVGLLVGSVVIVTTYQAMAAQQQQQPPAEPPAIIAQEQDASGSGSQQSDEGNPDSSANAGQNGAISDVRQNEVANSESPATAESEEPNADTEGSTADAEEPTSDSQQNDGENSDSPESAASEEPSSDPQQNGGGNAQSPTESEDGSTETLSSKWRWSADKQIAYLELYDSDGTLIESIPATVRVSEEPATCTQEGRRIFKATAVYEKVTYSDTRTEALSPLGHVFDSGKETVLENGETAMIFTCTRCHEEFTIVTSYTEND